MRRDHLSSQEVIEAVTQYRELTVGTVPFLNQLAASAALRVPKAYLRELSQECQKRLDLINQLIGILNDELALEFGCGPVLSVSYEPRAGHSVLISANPLCRLVARSVVVKNSLELTRYFIEQVGVAFSPGYSMGLDGLKLRLSFGPVGHKATYDEVYSLELEAIAKALKGEAPDVLAGYFVPVKGFEHGREIIKMAFLDRVLPALRQLLSVGAVVRAG